MQSLLWEWSTEQVVLMTWERALKHGKELSIKWHLREQKRSSRSQSSHHFPLPFTCSIMRGSGCEGRRNHYRWLTLSLNVLSIISAYENNRYLGKNSWSNQIFTSPCSYLYLNLFKKKKKSSKRDIQCLGRNRPPDWQMHSKNTKERPVQESKLQNFMGKMWI